MWIAMLVHLFATKKKSKKIFKFEVENDCTSGADEAKVSKKVKISNNNLETLKKTSMLRHRLSNDINSDAQYEAELAALMALKKDK